MRVIDAQEAEATPDAQAKREIPRAAKTILFGLLVGVAAVRVLNAETYEEESAASSQSAVGLTNQEQEAIEYTTSPREFVAKSIKDAPAVSIGVEETKTPVTWLTVQPQPASPDAFPAVIYGNASLVVSLVDIGAVTLNEDATKRSGIVTYEIDDNAIAIKLGDLKNLVSKPQTYNDTELYEKLRQTRPTISQTDVQRMQGKIESFDSEIDRLNLMVLYEKLQADSSFVLDTAYEKIRQILKEQAAAQGINPKEIEFKYPDTIKKLDLGGDLNEKLYTTPNYIYHKDQAVPRVTLSVNKLDESSNKEN